MKNVNIKDRVNIMFKKNNKIRLRAICQGGCEWTLNERKFNKDPKDPTFHSKTYKSKHNYCKEYVNRNMDYKWLVEKYNDSFLADPNFYLASFENLVYNDYVVIVLRMKL